MRLIRTPFEAIIEGSLAELADVGKKIDTIPPGSSLAFEARCEQPTSAKLVVTENGEPFLASWHPRAGLLIRGSNSALSAFADLFIFKCEPFPGLHTHWDVAGVFDFVDSESLPIVIQVE